MKHTKETRARARKRMDDYKIIEFSGTYVPMKGAPARSAFRNLTAKNKFGSRRMSAHLFNFDQGIMTSGLKNSTGDKTELAEGIFMVMAINKYRKPHERATVRFSCNMKKRRKKGKKVA